MSPSTATATATARTESPDTGSRLLEHDSTLIVGKSVSLTLGSDSLAIVGMSSLCFIGFFFFLLSYSRVADERASRKSDRDGCCGFLKSSNTLSLIALRTTKLTVNVVQNPKKPTLSRYIISSTLISLPPA